MSDSHLGLAQSKSLSHLGSGPPKSDHWADICAHKIVRERPKAPGEPFVCASGITPSGTVHIGNFREIISVELVVRALHDLGVPTRFIYSWDDYDVFRKVPANMPQNLEHFLRQSITRVPDVSGVAESYAAANEKELEALLPKVGVTPEFLYQASKYQASEYARGIRRALENRELIRSQLNEHRSRELPEDWWPVNIFCGQCHRDDTACTAWDGSWQLSYRCAHCHYQEEIDLRHNGLVKLPWRIDWPMRWAHEKVDFEPAGKDHHSEGGSFSTARKTCKEVYQFDPPHTFQYDFVRIKGLGGKISSSSGEVLSLADVLQIYPPEIVRYMFASTRPNAEFAISFDLDVLKVYDDFCRCEQAYYEPDKEGKAAKKQAKLRRIYQLSQVHPIPSHPGGFDQVAPFNIPLRHLCNLLQIHDGNTAAVRRFLGREGTPIPEHSLDRFQSWAECAKNWIKKYAPEEFRFQLRRPSQGRQAIVAVPFTAELQQFLPKLRQLLGIQFQALEFDRKSLSNGFYRLMQEDGLESRVIFPQIYQLLIQRNDGPRLLGFLEAIHSAIGLEGLLQLLDAAA